MLLDNVKVMMSNLNDENIKNDDFIGDYAICLINDKNNHYYYGFTYNDDDVAVAAVDLNTNKVYSYDGDDGPDGMIEWFDIKVNRSRAEFLKQAMNNHDDIVEHFNK